eukprot:scaffold3811_cov116-Isochrysis_galbana.AAC.1
MPLHHIHANFVFVLGTALRSRQDLAATLLHPRVGLHQHEEGVRLFPDDDLVLRVGPPAGEVEAAAGRAVGPLAVEGVLG